MDEKTATWQEIRIGVGVVLALAIALAAFWLGRAGNPFAQQYSLVFFVENAKGLHKGAPVRLSGLRVGDVAQVEIMGAARGARGGQPDQLAGMNIRVTIEVYERYRAEITDRSRARIASEGVSGMRYVRIEKGRVGGIALRSGDRLSLARSMDVEDMLDRGMEVVNRVEALNRYAQDVAETVKSGRGSLGKFLADPDDNPLAESFETMNLRAASVLRSLDEGPGTVALERRTRRVRENLDRFQRTLEEIQRGVRAGEGSLVAFAADSAFPNALQRLDARVATLQAKLDQGRGSLGRLANDPELFEQLDALTAQLDSLFTEVGEDPLGSADLELH